MIFKHRSFFIATLLALVVQVAAILVAKLATSGMDCGLTEQRVCSFDVFLQGSAQLVASINIYTLGVPTIALALLFGTMWRIYRELRDGGMRRRDFLLPRQ